MQQTLKTRNKKKSTHRAHHHQNYLETRGKEKILKQPEEKNHVMYRGTWAFYQKQCKPKDSGTETLKVLK